MKDMNDLREWMWYEVRSLDSAREDALEMGDEKRVAELYGMRTAYLNAIDMMG